MTTNGANRRLSARVSGLRGGPKSFDLTRDSREQQSAHDSLVRPIGKKRRTYVTSARAQGIADQLSDHDRQLLDILQCVHLASGRQLQLLLWGEGPSDSPSSQATTSSVDRPASPGPIGASTRWRSWRQSGIRLRPRCNRASDRGHRPTASTAATPESELRGSCAGSHRLLRAAAGPRQLRAGSNCWHSRRNRPLGGATTAPGAFVGCSNLMPSSSSGAPSGRTVGS